MDKQDEEKKRKLMRIMRRINPVPSSSQFQENFKIPDPRNINIWNNRAKLKDTSYAQHYQSQYEPLDANADDATTCVDIEDSLFNLDKVSTICKNTVAFEIPDNFNIDEFIDRFKLSDKAQLLTKHKLPIELVKSNLISSINNYNVAIVEGDTGTGKSTQLPYYLLQDSLVYKRRVPKIYVTQPRRIAAKSIASRVCDEHDWVLGSICGFQVGLDKTLGPQTMLTFCTTGILLQKLVAERSLDEYTHIIIDEVHERDEDTDLLLMMIKKLMIVHKKFFRLIIMSATMDSPRLSQYFSVRLAEDATAIIRPIVCKIEKARLDCFEVQVVYYERLQALYNLRTKPVDFYLPEPELQKELLETAVKIIGEVIPNLDTFASGYRSTLVFLPGLHEIDALHNLLKRSSMEDLDIIPLHSMIAANDQSKVFDPSEPGKRKVILATNIAESSITVHDVAYVIDFCLTKVLTNDQFTNFSRLKLAWSSKNQATQRAGRTGRCCPGKVFRLVTEKFFGSFPKYATPEVLLAPLELSVLKVKRLDMGDPQSLLALLLDPPPLIDIENAVLNLKQIGALTCKYNFENSTLDGHITDLGRVISQLPIDVRLSKLLVLGYVFDVLEDSIIIAACLSTNRSVVKYIYGNDFKSFENRFFWSEKSQNDLTVCRRVYAEYKALIDADKSRNYVQKWCEDYLLDENKLFEVDRLVQELKHRLDFLNIKKIERPNLPYWDSNDTEMMLNIALSGAFYPNYFLSHEIKETDVDKALLGRNPRETVVVDRFPLGDSQLYVEEVRQQLSEVLADYELESIGRAIYVKTSNKPRESLDLKKRRKLNKPSSPFEKAKHKIHKVVNEDVVMAIKFGQCVGLGLSLQEEKIRYHTSDNNIDFKKIHPLGGPFSPISLSFFSILQRCDKSNILIERASINSVLLDTNYKTSNRWLLIAASTSEINSGLMVRDTVLMPNVRGLAAMMALLFSQNYQYRYNDKLNCIGGACFGLGWDKDGASFHRYSDSDMSFDVVFDFQDIGIINKCRQYIREVIALTKVEEAGKLLGEKQDNIQRLLMRLLKRERFPINEVHISKLTKEDCSGVKEEEECLFMPVNVPTRSCDTQKFYSAIKTNLEYLRSIVDKKVMAPLEGTHCYLCSSAYDKKLIMYREIFDHLNSEEHIDKLRLLESKTCAAAVNELSLND